MSLALPSATTVLPAFVRDGPGDWKVAPGSQGITDAIKSAVLEEMMYQFGELRAAFWRARGEQARSLLCLYRHG